ncbi:MAG: DUF1749 domain-containing protein [Candidatus Marsarchaeota archaeon]|nr:DUF1749 domain-containing protein [Candidatus Marsarchaeota archaeon]
MAFPKKISIEKFSATDGVLLYGLLALPERARKKAVVVHVHGLASSFYGGSAVEELSRRITSEGIAFFSMQTRGSYTIESFDRTKGKNRTSFFAGGALERFEDCVYDIEGAIRFLSARGYNSIILEGHSTGCQKILYYHSKRKNKMVKGLILLAAGDDYNVSRVSLGKRFGAAVSDAKKAERKEEHTMMPPKYLPPWMMLSASRFLSTSDPKRPESQILNYMADRMKYVAGICVPALAVFGTDDMYMDAAGLPAVTAAEKLRKNSKRIETVVIRGADHGFHGRRRKLTNAVAEWIQRTLRGNA